MDTRHFHKRLFDATRQCVPAGTCLVCAVSGGADSMALLHGLHAVNKMRRCGWDLHVVHLDHGLPHDSAAMRAFVHQTAQSLDLPCTSDHVDVPALSEATGESIEEAGRKTRYALFERVAQQTGALAVALAHHADDQAETVLHRILRGTGLRGLIGMHSHRPIREGISIAIIRPLLTIRREDCRSYLNRRGLSYMEDSTNADVCCATRNRIRHEVLPLIRHTINPQAATALVRLAEQAERAASALRLWADAALADCRLDEKPDEMTLDAHVFSGLPIAVQTEVVMRVLQNLHVELKQIDFERIDAAACAGMGSGALRRIELPGGWVVERRGHRLRFRARLPSESSHIHACADGGSTTATRETCPVRSIHSNQSNESAVIRDQAQS